MSAPYPRPDPVDAADARFWAFVATGELRIQQCTSCRTFRHPPRPVCASCGSTDDEWIPSAGRGEVWTFTVIHPPTLPAFAERVPYGAVVVRLDEGVFMVSNLVDCPVDELAVETPVEVVITEVDNGLALPLFRRVTK
ncbi:MAG: uncharacterized protein QOI55_1256 [Actinomycetota bacterium]|nr:uncharacterized protein [Actinomycetota bacterium]